MTSTYQQMLARLRQVVPEVTLEDVRQMLERLDRPIIVDVREQHEVEEGQIPGAIHLPRGFLEMRVEEVVPDRRTPVVIYCRGGIRSLFAAETLSQMGYTNITQMAGGFTAWRDAGHPWVKPRMLNAEQRVRYSRHVVIPEVGLEGQLRLLDSRVLLVGAGGLGSPAAFYLAAAGVGTLGIVDSDVVDLSNLQRQILHTTDRIGLPKVESAAQTIAALNPDVNVVSHYYRLSAENVLETVRGYDVVMDGTDNFATRYLLNDACQALKKPLSYGAVFRFEGQVSTFVPGQSPCYRCLFPEAPPPELAPT